MDSPDEVLCPFCRAPIRSPRPDSRGNFSLEHDAPVCEAWARVATKPRVLLRLLNRGRATPLPIHVPNRKERRAAEARARRAAA